MNFCDMKIENEAADWMGKHNGTRHLAFGFFRLRQQRCLDMLDVEQKQNPRTSGKPWGLISSDGHSPLGVDDFQLST